MIHLGDITKIHGDQIEPVDCITFGSPCQDLSIAGRRAGLAGERSGLFMEAVRIRLLSSAKEYSAESGGSCSAQLVILQRLDLFRIGEHPN